MMTITHVYMVTGASKGLGAAITEQLLQPGHQLICISRSRNEELVTQANAAAIPLLWVEQDLAALSGEAAADNFMQELLADVQITDASHLRLINNAGMLDPIGPAQDHSAPDVSRHIALNLTGPMILTSSFLRATGSLAVDKRVMQISSGAGRSPYAGWSAYCAAKAGLDHYTRCVKLEQDSLPHGARVASVAPGVIDTGMQALIRGAGESKFPSHARFVDLYETGGLSTPEQAAGRLLTLLEDASFGDEAIVDIRTWSK